jgi:nitrilase
MERPVKVACVQVEPVVLDREATLDKLEQVAADAAHVGAELVVFPETFVPVYPSSLWAKAFAGWDAAAAKETFARLAEQSVAVGSPSERRIAAAAQELGVWVVTGVNEVEPERPGTIYNSLLYHSPDGELALHHRKLVPTNHERLVWGQGDGRGLEAVETG